MFKTQFSKRIFMAVAFFITGLCVVVVGGYGLAENHLQSGMTMLVQGAIMCAYAIVKARSAFDCRYITRIFAEGARCSGVFDESHILAYERRNL